MLLCASLIMTLGIVEIGLRFADHPLSRPLINFNRWYEPSERYGHQLVKNFEGLGPLHVPVTINSDGFRDIDRVTSKDGQTIRILGLGDSFTFGWGVSLEKTYLKRLEATLPQIIGHPVETINTGVPGWGYGPILYLLKGIRASIFAGHCRGRLLFDDSMALLRINPVRPSTFSGKLTATFR